MITTEYQKYNDISRQQGMFITIWPTHMVITYGSLVWSWLTVKGMIITYDQLL